MFALSERAILRIVKEEAQEIYNEASQMVPGHPKEARWALWYHLQWVKSLQTLDEVDDYLQKYRELSLEEWAESL